MRFAADRMLGKLAKWLRFLGYDTTYSNDLSEDEYLAQVNEGRILLTRNTRLKRKVAQDQLAYCADGGPGDGRTASPHAVDRYHVHRGGTGTGPQRLDPSAPGDRKLLRGDDAGRQPLPAVPL